MYATPVVYPLSQVPEEWRAVFCLNPMVAVIETFRYAYLGAGEVSLQNLAASFLITIVTLIVAVGVFNRVEKTFMDTI